MYLFARNCSRVIFIAFSSLFVSFLCQLTMSFQTDQNKTRPTFRKKKKSLHCVDTVLTRPWQGRRWRAPRGYRDYMIKSQKCCQPKMVRNTSRLGGSITSGKYPDRTYRVFVPKRKFMPDDEEDVLLLLKYRESSLWRPMLFSCVIFC